MPPGRRSPAAPRLPTATRSGAARRASLIALTAARRPRIDGDPRRCRSARSSSGRRWTARWSYRVLTVSGRLAPQPVTLVLGRAHARRGGHGRRARPHPAAGRAWPCWAAARHRLAASFGRDLRPLERMTAHRRAHLRRRPEHSESACPTTGRRWAGWATRSTRMLDQIETAFASQQQAALGRRSASEQQAASVRRRRVARAAHAADRGPRLCRPVPRGRAASSRPISSRR